MSVTYSATQMHGTLCYGRKKGEMAVNNSCIQWILWQTRLIQDMNYGSSILLPRKDMLDAGHLTYNVWNRATPSLDGTLREDWSEVSVAHPIPTLRPTIPDV